MPFAAPVALNFLALARRSLSPAARTTNHIDALWWKVRVRRQWEWRWKIPMIDEKFCSASGQFLAGGNLATKSAHAVPFAPKYPKFPAKLWRAHCFHPQLLLMCTGCTRCTGFSKKNGSRGAHVLNVVENQGTSGTSGTRFSRQ